MTPPWVAHNIEHLFSQLSGALKAATKVSTGLCFLGRLAALEKKPSLPFLKLLVAAGSPECSLACRGVPPACGFVSICRVLFPQCDCVSPSCKDTSYGIQGPS